MFDFDVDFAVLNDASVGLQCCGWVFLVLSCAYVEFPSVAGAHDDVVCENSVFEGAAHVRASVFKSEDLVAFSHEKDGASFDANGFHLVVFEVGFFYRLHKICVAHLCLAPFENFILLLLIWGWMF